MFFLVCLLLLCALRWWWCRRRFPRKIIFLSLARCNGTIALRFFGQQPQIQIANHQLTRFHDDVKVISHCDDDFRIAKLKALNKIACNSKCFISHEMADDLTTRELTYLISLGWQIVIIVRHPGKQYASLLDLQREGADENMRTNILLQGWTNLAHFAFHLPIACIIDGTNFCNSSTYRRSCFKQLGFKYALEYENMDNYLADDFHNVCQITKSWGYNRWNGLAAKSTQMQADNRSPINIDQISGVEHSHFKSACANHAAILQSSAVIK